MEDNLIFYTPWKSIIMDDDIFHTARLLLLGYPDVVVDYFSTVLLDVFFF